MTTSTTERSAADLRALFPGRYLSVTSFKRDGTAVATPVWFVRDGDRLLAITDAHSGKVKRLRRDPRVLVAPCRPSGRLRGAPVEGRADLLTDTADLDRTQRLLKQRYKVSYRVVMLGYRIGRALRRQPAVPDGAVLSIRVG